MYSNTLFPSRMFAVNHDTLASPQADAKAEVIQAFKYALQTSSSFLEFVGKLKCADIAFILKDGTPVLQFWEHSFCLNAIIGALPELNDAFRRWEGQCISFTFDSLEAKALRVRLEWMERANYENDLPETMSSLMLFVEKLDVNRVKDAMAIAFRKQGITGGYQGRFKYFCGVCRNMILRQPQQPQMRPPADNRTEGPTLHHQGDLIPMQPQRVASTGEQRYLGQSRECQSP